MFGQNNLIIVITALFLLGCSGSSKAEKESSLASSGDSKSDLALCTGGAVPEGATSCLLDLGTGEDSYWMDTDGVDPGTAGCHDEYATDACGEVKMGRAFGEFCLDDDRLVESNPEVNGCHTHGGDLGKPDVVSCSEWCSSEQKPSGRCEGGVQAEGASGMCESARCVCG